MGRGQTSVPIRPALMGANGQSPAETIHTMKGFNSTKEMRMKKIEYREQALKILPWVCASCGRDFTGKKLRELTVHHKDHNYKNNPPDGSNWELLCIYCHDNEHSRSLDAEWLATEDPDREKAPVATHSPFANLKDLMGNADRQKKKK